MDGLPGALKQAEVGRRAAKIALVLWPGLKLAQEGSERDRQGTDGLFTLGNFSVQVKGDARIAESGNLYVELFEKTVGKASQKWRGSPSKCEVYIFVTVGFAVWVQVDALARGIALAGVLRKILDTSIGILVPLAVVSPKIVKAHELWGQKMLL